MDGELIRLHSRKEKGENVDLVIRNSHLLFLLLPDMNTHAQVVVYDDCDDLSLLLPADCLPCFGSSGVSALDTMKPVTAPMTITGKRSVCPPKSPSKSYG